VGTLRTRSLVEGALLAALAAVLGLLSFYIGLGFIQPIPIAVAAMRNGGRTAFLASLVGAGLLALWVGPLAAAGTLGYDLSLGLTAGWLAEQTRSFVIVYAGMVISLLCAAVVGYFATLLIWHQNLLVLQRQAMTSMVVAMESILRSTSGSSAALALGHRLDQMIPALLPLGVLTWAALSAAAVYVVTNAVGTRLGTSLPAIPPFAHWRVPGFVAWGYAALVALLLLARTAFLREFAIDGVLGLGLVYATVGLSLGYGLLRDRARIARGSSVLLLICAVLFLTALRLSVLLVLAGLAASVWGGTGMRTTTAPWGRGGGGQSDEGDSASKRKGAW